MKTTLAIALLIGAAKAGNDCGYKASSGNGEFAPWSPQTNVADVQNQEENLDDNNGSGFGESLASSGLASLGNNFLNYGCKKGAYNLNGANDGSAALGKFLDSDRQNDSVLCITNHGRQNNNPIIDSAASNVQADFESCHVGETIIPALKEETQVKQAACYSSDSAAQYNLKGCSNNNYKMSGSLTQNECQVQKGGEKIQSSLCLKGNKNRKFCQNGNKALFGCADNIDGQGCDTFGLKNEILDEEALNVTTDPSKRVQEQVDAIVRGAISKTISQAVQFALDEALKDTINV